MPKPKIEKSNFISSALVGVRRSAYVCVLVLLWLFLGSFSVVSVQVYDTGILVIATLLVLLGVPTSLMIRLDRFGYTHQDFGTTTLLLFALLVVVINFAAIGGVSSLLPDTRKPKEKRVKKG